MEQAVIAAAAVSSSSAPVPISIHRASQAYNVSRLRLLSLIAAGVLHGWQRGGRWFVSRQDLDRLNASGGLAPMRQKG